MKTGNPIARTGYMVECASNADCHRLCGRHPLTSSHYVCQKRFELFDYSILRHSYLESETVASTFEFRESKLKTDPRGRGYFTSTSGVSNVSDPREGMGICVDSNSLLYQSCHNEGMAYVADGLIGCTDRTISRYLCGIEFKVRGGDPITASLDGNLFFPRVLVAGSDDPDGDGLTVPRMECSDPIDCEQRCKYLSRTSSHGAGTPPACALYAAFYSNLRFTPPALTWFLRCSDFVAVRRLERQLFHFSVDLMWSTVSSPTKGRLPNAPHTRSCVYSSFPSTRKVLYILPLVGMGVRRGPQSALHPLIVWQRPWVETL